MVVKERGRMATGKIVSDLLVQRQTLAQADQRRSELAAQVKAYESKYGIKSRSIHAAINRGQLKETQEVCRWIIDYDLLKRTKAS